MSLRGRDAIALLVAALLVAPPGYGSAEKPLGLVLEARNATLRAADSIAGTTVFAGDTVVTDHAGRVRVRMGEAQVEVLPDSIVIFEEIDSVAGANVVAGTVGFSSPETSSVAVRAAGILIRPQANRRTQGQVKITSPSEFLVTSFHGPLELTLGNESLVVPEGTTYRVVQGGSQGPGPVGAGAEAARRAPFKAYLLAFAIVAIPLVTVITINLLASPSSIF